MGTGKTMEPWGHAQSVAIVVNLFLQTHQNGDLWVSPCPTQDDYVRLFADYRKTTLESELVAIESVAGIVKSKPSVLVCMEAKPQCCHRSHLAKVISNRSRLQVKHLT